MIKLLLVLILLVLVIMLVILIKPDIKENFTQKQKIDTITAQSAIAALRQTYRVHYQTYGSVTDYDIEQALEDTNLGNRTEKNWEFEVKGNPPKKYIATSTAEFSQGKGKQVWYDVEEAQYHGYGIDGEIYER